MGAHERPGKSDEWYTPAYIFEALGVLFDLDVAVPEHTVSIPAYGWVNRTILKNSLTHTWSGFVWMNPPFGKRNGLEPWLDKFFAHGHGIALTPDRTSAPWWQSAMKRCNGVLFISPRVRFLKPDGTTGKSSPGTGTCLFAAGPAARAVLMRAAPKLGVFCERARD